MSTTPKPTPPPAPTTVACPLCPHILNLIPHPRQPDKLVALCDCGQKRPDQFLVETDAPAPAPSPKE